MEQLEKILDKYGNILTTKDIANIYGCSRRTAYSIITNDSNFPRMKGFKNIRVNTTNFFLYELADRDRFVYNKIKDSYVRGELKK